MKIDIKIYNNDEIWKDIEGHDNIYQVSSDGRVRQKSHYQKYIGRVYTNNGSKDIPIKRFCGERLLSHSYKCGKPALVFRDGTWVWIEDLMNKYFK